MYSSDQSLERKGSLNGPKKDKVEVLNDPKYKRYVVAMERILQSFDTINEWPDIITFLGKLVKTVQSYPMFPVIPHKLVLSKRLSQCLNPALPAGVHQKTLEVYSTLFDVMGSDMLSQDLSIWSYGLFPFFQFAAMSVKPLVLQVFQRYYLPLGPNLKPCLKSFVSGLLPGLEEEDSEDFNLTIQMLDSIAKVIPQSYFFHCIWLILIVGSQYRRPALNYLLKRIPKTGEGDEEDVAFILGTDPSLLVRALSAALMDDDKHNLVQRSALELLVGWFPLNLKLFMPEDMEYLMTSMLNVVLRRDMSLIRRIYAWLLGPSDDSTPYFNKFARPYLASALKSVLYAKHLQSSLIPRDQLLSELQKPYKILISLLDKTEIGIPLVDDVLIDVFLSLKIHSSDDTIKSEMFQTANMFLSMIDPYLIWKKLFLLFTTKLTGLKNSKESNTRVENEQQMAACLESLHFVLDTAKLTDDESKRFHLPFWVLYILNILQASPTSPPPSSDTTVTSPLQSPQIKPQLLHIFFDESTQDSKNSKINKYIDLFYFPESSTIPFNLEFEPITGPTFLSELFYSVSQFTGTFVNEVVSRIETNGSGDCDTAVVNTSMVTSFRVACDMVLRVHKWCVECQKNVVAGGTNRWLKDLIRCCYSTSYFAIVDTAVSCIIELQSQLNLIATSDESIEVVFTTHSIKSITIKLHQFLSPSYTLIHHRVTELIWSLLRITKSPSIQQVFVEGIIADSGSTLDIVNPKNRTAGLDKFGVFWKYSVNIPHANIYFSRCLFLVLDTVRDANPMVKRSGETWIRNYMKSYIKLLDPLLLILFDRFIVRESDQQTFEDEGISYYKYVLPPNYAQINYAFELLLTVCKFGGASLLKSLRLSKVTDTLVSDNIRLDNTEAVSFMEILVKGSLRYLQSELASTFPRSYQLLNTTTKLHAIEFIQLVISKSDSTDISLLTLVQQTVIQQLFVSLHLSQFDLQAKLLHLLYSTLYAISQMKKSISIQDFNSVHGSSESIDLSSRDSPSSQISGISGLSPLFVKTLLKGLSSPTNRPMLHHWTDFLLFSLPVLKTSFNTVLFPVIHTLSNELLRIVDIYHQSIPDRNVIVNQSFDLPSEDDIVTYINSIEKVIVLCLSDSSLKVESENTKGDETGGGLFSFVFGDLTGDVTKSEQKVRDIVIAFLPNVLQVFRQLWSVFARTVPSPEVKPESQKSRQPSIVSLTPTSPKMPSRKDSSTSQSILPTVITPLTENLVVSDDVKFRLLKTMERFQRICSNEFLESMICVWNNATMKGQKDDVVLDMLTSIPGYHPRSMLVAAIDAIKIRTTSASRGRKLTTAVLSSKSILHFLEYFVTIVSPNVLVEQYTLIASFVKELLTQGALFRELFAGLGRVTITVLDRITSVPDFEEKKFRKEFQDIFQKLCDSAISTLVACRFDQDLTASSDDKSPTVIPTSPSMTLNSARRVSFRSTISPDPHLSTNVPDEVVVHEVLTFLAHQLVPSARKILQDQDKVVSIFVNLMYYLLNPVLKNPKSISHRNMLEILNSMTKLQFSAKAWKKEVWDTFLNAKFYPVPSDEIILWRSVMKALCREDRGQYLIDVLNRIVPVPSTNIFSSRQTEILTRCTLLRRLSYLIFVGDKDQYLPQLPMLQEKIVELFKYWNGEVFAEVLLCLRVLLVRIGSQHLSNFWPLLHTELIRVLTQNLEVEPANQSFDDLITLLSTCKFLDCLIALGIPEFQIHQWIYISDSISTLTSTDKLDQVEGISAPPTPGLLDELGEKWKSKDKGNDGKLNVSNRVHATNPDETDISMPTPRKSESCFKIPETRRPIIQLAAISSPADLQFFAKYLHVVVYRYTFDLRSADMEYIESYLETELTDGICNATLNSRDAAGNSENVPLLMSSLDQDRFRGISKEKEKKKESDSKVKERINDGERLAKSLSLEGLSSIAGSGSGNTSVTSSPRVKSVKPRSPAQRRDGDLGNGSR
ncbi:Dopey, N-terminal-domain-containing protein [Paraphysoderma sedebokerense]|nr:Dopey, N-terminal-domain-containing protein [Paraphysoderma sedebokerense]